MKKILQAEVLCGFSCFALFVFVQLSGSPYPWPDMNRTTSSRAIRWLHHSNSVVTGIRASSSVVPSPTKRSKPSNEPRNPDRNVNRTILKDLVDLHHTSASFLHSPDDIAIGFENAFRNTYNDPEFIPYRQYRDDTLNAMSERGAGGLDNLVERASMSSVGKELSKRERLRAAPVYRRTFKKVSNPWSDPSSHKRYPEYSQSGMFSERELAVKEALLGTWERGGAGMEKPEPSLDGVLEFLKAKRVTVKEYAKEWERRNQIDKEGTP